MNEFARLPAAERRVYFEEAAARLGKLTPQLIEKDFWVCWLLQRVFALEEFGPHLTFKGGTSLSKCYQIIERFSEDVDLALERSFLGFGDEHEPERGSSRKERDRRVDALRSACQVAIQNRLFPALEKALRTELPHGEWTLTIDEADPDSQSLRFLFPASIDTGLNSYFASSVKLELGARSDHFPIESQMTRPYLADVFPQIFRATDTRVRVLHPVRTFWEKATILHAHAHLPPGKLLAKAQSRHYYDLHQLANHPCSAAAVSRLDLLERVATHKSVFFSSAQAKYDEARPGTLKLIPSAERIDELRRDFLAMAPMFFGPVPTFEKIMARLIELQNEINSAR